MSNDLNSEIAGISQGTIEYLLSGDGPTILISHGSLGGFDQGLAIAGLFDQDQFSFLSVSRAGYLRSDPDTGRTPEAQALSYSELLDHLGIDTVGLVALSGGASSAITFSELYPDRCWALILVSSITTAPPPLPPFFRLAVRTQNVMMRFDFLWTLMHRYGLRALVRSNGVSQEQTARILTDPRLLPVVRGIFEPIKTSSLRRLGVRIDDEQINSLPVERKLNADIPTYIAHAVNDPLAPVSAAARLAQGNPMIEYHEYYDGGHLFFVVHSRQVIPSIKYFLMANVPDRLRDITE